MLPDTEHILPLQDGKWLRESLQNSPLLLPVQWMKGRGDGTHKRVSGSSDLPPLLSAGQLLFDWQTLLHVNVDFSGPPGTMQLGLVTWSFSTKQLCAIGDLTSNVVNQTTVPEADQIHLMLSFCISEVMHTRKDAFVMNSRDFDSSSLQKNYT